MIKDVIIFPRILVNTRIAIGIEIRQISKWTQAGET